MLLDSFFPSFPFFSFLCPFLPPSLRSFLPSFRHYYAYTKVTFSSFLFVPIKYSLSWHYHNFMAICLSGEKLSHLKEENT